MTTAGPRTAAAAAARMLSRLSGRARDLPGAGAAPAGRAPRAGAQGAVPELARDAGGAGVQDDRVDGRGAPGDLGDGRDGGVVPADVDGGQVRPGQDEADHLAVDEAVGVPLAVFWPVQAGTAVTVSSPPPGRGTV